MCVCVCVCMHLKPSKEHPALPFEYVWEQFVSVLKLLDAIIILLRTTQSN